ncbi:MAG: aconitase/3-isopropylmalate dehydratase large subunit family protein [Thermoplasmata archaeon]
MTGKTVIEKIFSAHSDEDAVAGGIVWVNMDIRSARDFGGANVVQNFKKFYQNDKVHDASKTFFTFDCNVPANNIPYANNQQVCRVFAKEQGIKVFDVNAGIGSHVMIEEGLALPGSTVVGTDSHLNIMGAVGAFGQGMGDQDIAFVFRAGKTWFEVPETIKIVIKGELPKGCSAKDLTLFLTGKLGASGALGKAVEYYGPAIEKLSLAGRITLASMATEMGAIISFIRPDKGVIDHFKAVNPSAKIAPVYADEDAVYCKVMEFDISNLVPQIAKPPKPDNVVPVREVKNVRVDSVFIGSCTNGTYEDIKAVAELVKGRKVKEHVMAKIVPATRKTYSRLLEEGILRQLFEAGFIISHPGCGGCASGQLGMTGKGEIQVSTSNRNFAGKQGDGDTYLASPETAAASAILGRIATADEMLKEVF